MFTLRHLRTYLEIFAGFLLLVPVFLMSYFQVEPFYGKTGKWLYLNFFLITLAVFSNAWLAWKSNLSVKEWFKLAFCGLSLGIIPGGIYVYIFGLIFVSPKLLWADTIPLIMVLLFIIWLLGYFVLAGFTGYLVLTRKRPNEDNPTQR